MRKVRNVSKLKTWQAHTLQPYMPSRPYLIINYLIQIYLMMKIKIPQFPAVHPILVLVPIQLFEFLF